MNSVNADAPDIKDHLNQDMVLWGDILIPSSVVKLLDDQCRVLLTSEAERSEPVDVVSQLSIDEQGSIVKQPAVRVL